MNVKLNIIILLSLIFISNCDITIIGPKELASQFNFKPIEMTFDKIGRSSYDFYSRGELCVEKKESNLEACNALENRVNEGENISNENNKILIAKRGGCSFVQKARNAQSAGYSMIIIVNNIDIDIKNVIMSDDGSGNDIFIPVVMIYKDEGEKIINFLQKAEKNKKILAEINFLDKNKVLERVDVKIFFSSSEKKAYELFSNLAYYMYKFKDQVNLIPIYVVHRSPMYNENSPIRIINCVSLGKYCYFPKETTITKDGQAIIIEDIRQKCIYNLYKENNTNIYFDYLHNYYSHCLIDEKSPQFNENCAKNVLKKLSYPIHDIEKCIAKSFDVNDLLSNLYIDKDNKILENEYNEILKYKLTTFPAVIINNKPLEGIIKEKKIINEICGVVKDKPEFCSYISRMSGQKRRRIIIYSLIIFLIALNIIIFLICRKYIVQRINERIEEGGLDLDSRIKNVIGNYFSLNQINNDYTRMKNNNDFNNQKGKVVDIAIESN